VFWCQRELGKELNDSDLFFKLPSMPFVFVLNVGPFAFGICFGALWVMIFKPPHLHVASHPSFDLNFLHYKYCTSSIA
jgi:hypothetical protein